MCHPLVYIMHMNSTFKSHPFFLFKFSSLGQVTPDKIPVGSRTLVLPLACCFCSSSGHHHVTRYNYTSSSLHHKLKIFVIRQMTNPFNTDHQSQASYIFKANQLLPFNDVEDTRQRKRNKCLSVVTVGCVQAGGWVGTEDCGVWPRPVNTTLTGHTTLTTCSVVSLVTCLNRGHIRSGQIVIH